jgi:hypothetical protein
MAARTPFDVMLKELRAWLAVIQPHCGADDFKHLRYRVDRFAERRRPDTPMHAREHLRSGYWAQRDMARAMQRACMKTAAPTGQPRIND